MGPIEKWLLQLVQWFTEQKKRNCSCCLIMSLPFSFGSQLSLVFRVLPATKGTNVPVGIEPNRVSQSTNEPLYYCLPCWLFSFLSKKHLCRMKAINIFTQLQGRTSLHMLHLRKSTWVSISTRRLMFALDSTNNQNW